MLGFFFSGFGSVGLISLLGLTFSQVVFFSGFFGVGMLYSVLYSGRRMYLGYVFFQSFVQNQLLGGIIGMVLYIVSLGGVLV